MAKSILQPHRDYCFLCGKNGAGDRLEEHHIFGSANRKLSEADGLKVYLCGNECHRNGKQSAHRNADVARFLKMAAQEVWERTYGNREEFIKRYGKSYL